MSRMIGRMSVKQSSKEPRRARPVRMRARPIFEEISEQPTYQVALRNFARAQGRAKESGYVDLASASYALNTTGSVTLIATIAQGAAVTQRIGKKVMLKSIQIHGYCSSDSTTTTAPGALLVIYDKRPTGSVPTVGDILDSASSQSFMNDANSGRFRVLMRRDYVLAGNVTTAGQQTSTSILPVQEFLKVNRQAVFKAAGTGAIGDIEEGALYLVSIGNLAAGTADANATLAFRTRFVDF